VERESCGQSEKVGLGDAETKNFKKGKIGHFGKHVK
jgi:hypothetical protein